MSETILVVDDEKNIRRTLRMVLDGEGFQTLDASSAESGLAILHEHGEIDLVILDLQLPGMGGLQAIAEIRNRVTIPIIVISGHGTISDAVSAVQRGASDFLEKPLDRDRVLVSVRNALKTSKLEREVRALRAEAEERYEMIGQSQVMRQLFAELEKVAPTRGRVLITGESGTGKELIARAIHRLSSRAGGPFVKVNCAAIPDELIESELFGYERGAFTGAHGKKKGLFEVADEGTLLLDEIGDMSLTAQAKVLRALQSGEISRVGSETSIGVDVRVIAATNKDLVVAVERGEFREDLYYRLNVVPIRSPSLRERPDDIPDLAQGFLREFCAENGIRPKPIDAEVLESLSHQTWPGNVRELRNVVERMAILSGDRITIQDLPAPARGSASTTPPHVTHKERESLRDYRDRTEREYIQSTLLACDWNISKAATQLGIERTNLHKRMRALGLKRDSQPPADSD